MVEEESMRRHLKRFLGITDLEANIARVRESISKVSRDLEKEAGSLGDEVKANRETLDNFFKNLNDQCAKLRGGLEAEKRKAQTVRDEVADLRGRLSKLEEAVDAFDEKIDNLIDLEVKRLDFYEASEILQALKQSKSTVVAVT